MDVIILIYGLYNLWIEPGNLDVIIFTICLSILVPVLENFPQKHNTVVLWLMRVNSRILFFCISLGQFKEIVQSLFITPSIHGIYTMINNLNFR